MYTLMDNKLMDVFRKSSDIFKDFCNNSDVSGCKYIIDKRSSLITRILWTCCYSFLLITTGFLVANLWYSFMENPTVTSLQSSSYPVAEVPFPGISICNVNKISKKKAINFANDLANITKGDPDILLEKIKLLGHMYDFYSPNNAEMVQFQILLDTLRLHPRYILSKLITTCEELLLRCEWEGDIVECSKHFQFRLTFEGYCCLFNYLKEENHSSDEITTMIIDEKVKHQRESGSRKGLSVYIRNDPDDYFFTTLPTMGIKVHIFIPSDFPDINSGSLSNILVGLGSETFMAMVPTVFTSDDGVKKYPLEKRKCFFGMERKTVFGKYSESDCLVDCRIKKMLTLCGCVPFMMPINKTYVCTLSDIPCLNKHVDKWTTLAPSNPVDDELDKELEDGLSCQYRCYPSCSSTLYEVTTNCPKLHVTNKQSDIRPTDTIVHIYFKYPFVNHYRQDEFYVWFEILSNFGGIFSLVVGLSIISVVEIIVFSCKYICFRVKHQ